MQQLGNQTIEQDSSDDKYDTIKYYLERFRSVSFEKVNLFAIVTYIQISAKCIVVTMVDDSCGLNDRLKGNVFNSGDKNFQDYCQIGDIVRFKRVKIQEFNRLAQGLVSQHSSWVTFKKDSNEYHTKYSSSTVSEMDKKRVKELRDWLKGNPQNQSLFEACLSSVANMNDTLTPEMINQAAAVMNMAHSSSPTRQAQPISSAGLFTTFSNLSFSQGNNSKFTHYDMVCQLCAVCATTSVKFLVLWDGTKSNYAVLQENDFIVDDKTCNNQPKVLYSSSISDLIFHVFIFDEFVAGMNNFKPGDYIMLKNARLVHNPPSAAGVDFLIKMPGEQGKKYGRAIIKLASYEDLERFDNGGQFSCANKEAEKIIKSIHQKGKELKINFINPADFIQECSPAKPGGLDDTFQELVKDKPTGSSIHATKSNSANVLTEKQQVAAVVSPPKPAIIAKSGRGLGGPMTRSKAKLVEAAPTNELDRVVDLLADHSSQYDDNEENQVPTSTAVNKSPKLKRKQNESSSKTAESPNKLTAKATTSISPPPRRSPRLTNNIESSEPVKSPPKASLPESNRQSPRMSQSASKTSEIRIPDFQPSQPKSQDSGRVNLYQICPDILRFKRLTMATYVAPYMTSPGDCTNSLPYLPHFRSLNDLAKEAANRTHMKCYVVAKVFNHSSTTTPIIVSVYVHCPKCNYINFTPFHLANIYHYGQLSLLLNEADAFKTSTQLGGTQQVDEMEMIDEDSRAAKNAINFDIDWLQSVYPVHSNAIPSTQQATQAATQSSTSDNLTYEYECPRCMLTKSDPDEPPVILEYIYRFWFILRDANSRLDPCLLEGPLAARMVDHIAPIKFYANANSISNQVYSKIHKSFNQKYLFTIETYNLKDYGGVCQSESEATTSSTANTSINSSRRHKSVDILYKIVEMEEIKSK